MSPGELNADAGLPGWDHRIAEAYHINVFSHHLICELAGKSGIAEKDWSDWAVLVAENKEPSFFHLSAEVLRVTMELAD